MAKGLKGKLKKAQAFAKKVQKIAQDVKRIEAVAASPMAHLGGAVGKRLGHKKIGTDVGRFLGKIVGTGDYAVRGNTLATSSQIIPGDAVPMFTDVGRGIRVAHREYLGKVISSSDGSFAITQYALNPGLFATFPWLSVIAAQFDEWIPNGMVAVFKSTASSYSATSGLGSVILATDYDAEDAPYASAIEMANSEFAVSCSIADSLVHPIECAERERPTRVLKTRQGAITFPKFNYDLGNFYVATEGAPANVVIGELWLSYDITFLKSQLFGGILGRGLQESIFRFSGFDNTNPFSTSQTYASNSGFQLQIATSAMAFPYAVNRGTFLVTCAWDGNSVTSDVGVTYTSGCAAGPKLWWVSGAGASIYRTTGTDNQLVLMFTVTLTSSSPFTLQVVTLNSVSLPSGGGGGSVAITPINPSVGY